MFNIILPLLKQLGFKRFDVNLCVFKNDEIRALIILYVDDIEIAGPTKRHFYIVVKVCQNTKNADLIIVSPDRAPSRSSMPYHGLVLSFFGWKWVGGGGERSSPPPKGELSKH